MTSSPQRDILSAKSATEGDAIWNPVTEAIPTHGLTVVRFSMHNDCVGIYLKPGIQYSDDGSTWSTPEKANTLSYVSTTGLVHWNTRVSCPDDFGSSPPTERLYARLGFWAYNVSGTKPLAGSVRLIVDQMPTVSGTLAGGPRATPSSGSTSTCLFTPLLEPVPAGPITEVRCTFDMSANTGEALTQPAYQTSDDGVTWSAATAIGAATLSADGVSHGTGWVSISVNTKRHVRFGILTKNATGSENEACISRLRVDWRS